MEDAVRAALDAGTFAFAHIWEPLDRGEQIFLSIAAALPPEEPFSKSAAVNKLEEANLRFFNDFGDAPDRLTKTALLMEVGEKRYRFATEMFRRWISRTWPVERIKGLFASSNDEAQSLYKEAQDLYVKRDYPGADEKLRQSLKCNPNYHDAMLLQGQVRLASKDYAGAVSVLEELHRFDAEMATSDLILALTERAQEGIRGGSLAEAAEAFGRILELSEARREAQRDAKENLERIAQQLAQQEAYAEVEEIYTRLARFSPNDEEAKKWRAYAELPSRYDQAMGALARQDWAQTIELLGAIIRVEPRYLEAAAHLARAVSEERTGRPVAEAHRPPDGPPFPAAAVARVVTALALSGVVMLLAARESSGLSRRQLVTGLCLLWCALIPASVQAAQKWRDRLRTDPWIAAALLSALGLASSLLLLCARDPISSSLLFLYVFIQTWAVLMLPARGGAAGGA